MRSKNITCFICFLLMGTGFSACKKLVTVDPPITQLVTANVFSNDGTATAALLSVYPQIGQYPYYIHTSTGLSSDELYTYASDQTTKDFYTNGLVAADGNNQYATWNIFYQCIYQVNAVMENLQPSTGVSPRVRQQLIGEAEFLRAYLYFYLVNLYGDVPLVTTTNYQVNASIAKTPKAEVYQQMVIDLKAAQTDLSENYVDGSDTATTVDRVRPTTWAADALLSRTYLYMGNGYYDSAEQAATRIIGNTTLYTLLPDLNAVFKMNSKEAIWQTMFYEYGQTPYFTPEAGYYIFTTPPTLNSFTISTQLLSAFEPGDHRRQDWVGTYTSGASSWYYPAKYKDITTTATTTSEYTMMLRLGEQYLIRAEARAQQGKTTDALADLDSIRTRAGLGIYTGPTDLPSLLAAIAHERQVELFVEGDRWIDLKRTGAIDSVMNLVTPQKGGNWNTNQQLYPFPPAELLNNPKLVQNPGY